MPVYWKPTGSDDWLNHDEHPCDPLHNEPIDLKWTPHASGTPTNPLLTPDTIVSAGPCSDPNCERCTVPGDNLWR